MDAIQAARQLGKAIQSDERFIAMNMASQKSEEDQELQGMIQEFNRQRDALNAALATPDRDSEKVKKMDTDIKDLYGKIFANSNMRAFNETRSEFQNLISFVNQIISGSTQGQDPNSIDFSDSCGGDCSGCSGCN